ncbi:succinate dehydrogenase, hydrophobic membrane anchor protein [Marinimicrobium sp. ABcell2]|uniref:succinate dehydrogenase, hydrophobic membrane anchor protein n=1 Tax=Marinimicrobium sp. ABcell2 TaxID=3069751 RepID=UPI0027B5A52A|nr:succinate dehydrogenase, hydrophobic membrane anchor protein [Marinimicrobium sp. ABcell2]MDQ2075429.1 succinate dehydrogenase, hydrophobic membrane anchor protein [Marinimicrobium sp. ABcell2]
MVTTVTSLGRSGVADWLLQRVSALIMLAYTIFLVGYILLTPELDYTQWRALFDQLWMRIFSLITLISIVGHAWIGLWIVLTDYLTERVMGGKGTVLRLLCQLFLGLVAVTYTLWGIEIIWGF